MKMTNENKFIMAEISDVGIEGNSCFEVSYDFNNNILHLFDDGEHRSTSLINSINSAFKKDILKRLRIKDKKTRCFLYQNRILWEYSFKLEKKGEHPFIKIEDRSLLFKPFQQKNLTNKPAPGNYGEKDI